MNPKCEEGTGQRGSQDGRDRIFSTGWDNPSQRELSKPRDAKSQMAKASDIPALPWDSVGNHMFLL